MFCSMLSKETGITVLAILIVQDVAHAVSGERRDSSSSSGGKSKGEGVGIAARSSVVVALGAAYMGLRKWLCGDMASVAPYFVDNPLFRSFWEQGKVLFANALFF